jgi:hypothetical protein
MGWWGTLKKTLEGASDATAIPNVRNFSGRVSVNQASGDERDIPVMGDRFLPERSYFSVRIAEMRLSEAARYWVEFVPMCSCFLRYTYGASQRNIPYILGAETIAAGLGKDVTKNAAKNIEFKDLYVARNVPVKADNLVMYAALCRFADSGFARGLLNLFSDAAGAAAGPVGGAVVRGATDMTARLASLLGADGVQTRFGTLAGNVLDTSGYRVFAGIPSDELDADDLQMRGGQLVRQAKDGTATTIDNVDYLVVALEHRSTLVDDQFGQVSILPFHARWNESREKLLTSDKEGANATFQKLMIEVASSPDVTEADRLGLITAYRAGFEQWAAIGSVKKGALMAGQEGSLAANLFAVEKKSAGPAAAVIQAVRESLHGAQQRGSTDAEALKSQELAFLSDRAQAVSGSARVRDQDDVDLRRAFSLLVPPLLN